MALSYGSAERSVRPARRRARLAPSRPWPSGRKANGVEAVLRADGSLEVPGEAVTDPVAYTLRARRRRRGPRRRGSHRRPCRGDQRAKRAARARASGRRSKWPASRRSTAPACSPTTSRALAGDDSFAIYPRKGEFFVFDPPDGAPLQRILLPVPTARTKGVLVFPTVDGKVIAGPTAHDQEDKTDWSVRPEARGEVMDKAREMYPPLEGAEPIASYAGLRPAGRGVNYLIGPSPGLRAADQRRRHPLDGAVRLAGHRRAGGRARRRTGHRARSRAAMARRGARLGWSVVVVRGARSREHRHEPSADPRRRRGHDRRKGDAVRRAPAACARGAARQGQPPSAAGLGRAGRRGGARALSWRRSPSCSTTRRGRWSRAAWTTRASRCWPGTPRPGAPLTPIVVWQDKRSQEVLERLQRRRGGDQTPQRPAA